MGQPKVTQVTAISSPKFIILNPIILLIKRAKTMFIIVFTMILIVATIIDIVFTKIGGVLKRLKCYGNEKESPQ